MKQRFSTRTRLVSALLTLAMVFTFLPISAFAEVQTYIPLYKFPDETFREYLEQFDKDDDTFLSTAERNAVKTIDVSEGYNGQKITSLKGIEFFPNLETLWCYENQLTSLDVSKNPELNELRCHENQLTSLDVSENTKLTILTCGTNKLTSLDVSQNTALKGLSCSNNQLTELDVRQNAELVNLYCSDNQLTELDVSRNNKLFRLDASNNCLTNLNVDNTSITIFDSNSKFAAKSNTYPISVGSDRTFDLSTLPGTFDVTKATRWNGGTVSGNTLTVNAGATKVTYLYDCGKRASYTFTLNVTVVPEGSIGIDASNFPDPNFRAYVKEKFDTDNNNSLSESERNAVTEIYVGNKNITNLEGIKYFPKLEILYCYKNQLTELDVSKNAALKELECYENNLTSLDVSKNAELVALYCFNNQLTSLDVRKNTKLESLWCGQNNLTSLDVRKNTALTHLSCEQNQLTSLDVRQNAALKYLVCDQNQLTELDVRQNAALTHLGCYQNQLTSLDVRQNKALEYLYCQQNYLTSLDVSKNTKLEQLWCFSNQLSSLDVSQHTLLRGLRCSQNNLTSLNVENTQVDLPAVYLTIFEAENNTYLIAVGSDRTFNLSTLPGTFDVTKATNWSGGTVSGKTLTVDEGVDKVTYTYDCGKGFSRDFTLNVKVGTVTPPSGGDTPGGGSTGGGDGGGAVVIVAAAGAAVAGVVGYGVYNYVSGRKLQALLPEGVAAPENRAQTALLLWNTAGRPEPADAPAFADVADPDTAKAAQWCVEQGLMKRRLNGKFAPGSSIPAYQVLNAYRKVAG